ncbi:MAG: LamG domain-containing protein [Cytophagaceae bacterium]|nr:LamG domain-containing protein [Cytophagaceae bacterium]
MGNVTELITNSPFSITFWIKAPSSTTLSRAIISNLNSNKNFYVSLLNTGKIYFGFGNGSSMAGFASNQNIADDTWHHVGITYDITATTAKIYIDGALDNTRTSTSITKQYGKTMIGDHPSSVIGLSKMTGKLDEFRIYNRFLSDSETQNVYNGGPDYDYAKSILQTSDGGFVIAGWSRSGISVDKSEASTTFDYWIVKLNAQGQKIWDKTIGGNSEDIAESIIQTSDGGFVVAGISYSNSSGDKSEISRGGFDYWIVKLNAQGQKIWDKTIGGDSDEQAKSIIQTSDGGLVIFGYTRSSASGDKTEA